MGHTRLRKNAVLTPGRHKQWIPNSVLEWPQQASNSIPGVCQWARIKDSLTWLSSPLFDTGTQLLTQLPVHPTWTCAWPDLFPEPQLFPAPDPFRLGTLFCLYTSGFCSFTLRFQLQQQLHQQLVLHTNRVHFYLHFHPHRLFLSPLLRALELWILPQPFLLVFIHVCECVFTYSHILHVSVMRKS